MGVLGFLHPGRGCDDEDLQRITEEARQRRSDDVMVGDPPGAATFKHIITTSNLDELRAKAKRTIAEPPSLLDTEGKPDRLSLRKRWRQLKRELKELEGTRGK
jgi:hypothetical protein